MKHFYALGLLVSFILMSSAGLSQNTRYYTYDPAGNRIKRSINLSKSLKNTGSLAQSEDKVILDDTFVPSVIKIYPNPTKGSLEVEIPDDPENPSELRIVVIDMSGRVIVDMPNGSLRTRIDLSNQHSGMYILNIMKGKQVSQWKIIKE